jgi:hypothetical protein
MGYHWYTSQTAHPGHEHVNTKKCGYTIDIL